MNAKKYADGLTTLKNDLFITDKDSKIRYLEKALDCVSFASGGVPLAAKPGKIVSGQVKPAISFNSIDEYSQT